MIKIILLALILIFNQFKFSQSLKSFKSGSDLKKNTEANARDTTGLGLKLFTGAILNVGNENATVTGHIENFNKYKIISAGFCWNIRPNPTLLDYRQICYPDSGKMICTLTGLASESFYFIRTYTVTDADTVYSEDKIFYTHRPDAVSDVDGNFYNTIKIGNQVWLAEDLKVSRLNDGTPVKQEKDPKLWISTKDPAWCWYANDSANYSFPRGKLYNWYAVNTGKLCPQGWHVPSNREWEDLQIYLGGDSVAGGKMKTTGTFFWRSPNVGATNETGFSAIPGGYRDGTGQYTYSTMFNRWWSLTVFPPEGAYTWYVYHGQKNLYQQGDLKLFGNSVRCLKDN